MLISLVYVSSAAYLLSNDELMALLETCRTNNTRLDVSGMLLYKDGNFLQVLEGEEPAVLGLTETIQRDPRHKGFIRLIQEPIASREFPDWSMGFRDLSRLDSDSVPGYNQFMNESLDSEAIRSNPSRARKLLALFRKNN